jgi:glycosyltransferase involved in cell wall biosynthesis
LLEEPAAAEIAVAVDGSEDGSYELLCELATRHPRLTAFYLENRGRVAARQAALERTAGDVVLFLDDDVLAGPGLVPGHAAAHAGKGGCVVLGYMPVQLPARRRPGDAPTVLYAAEYENRCLKYERDPSLVLTSLWGGNFSMPREDAVGIGLLSEFGHEYHEDTEFGLRCMKAGLRGVFDRTLRADHLHEVSLAGFRRDARRQGAARVQIQRLHSDILPWRPQDSFTADLPRLARALVRASRQPMLYRLSCGCLLAAAEAAGKLKLWPIETAGLKLLRRIEQEHGAAEAVRGRSAFS